MAEALQLHCHRLAQVDNVRRLPILVFLLTNPTGNPYFTLQYTDPPVPERSHRVSKGLIMKSSPILTPRCHENCTLLSRICHFASLVWRDTRPINVASSNTASRSDSIRSTERPTRFFHGKTSFAKQ